MPVERVCQNPLCRKTFTTFPSEIRKGGGKFCSHPCRTLALPFVCVRFPCHNFVLLTPSQISEGRKYCSRVCSEMSIPLEQRFWSYVEICKHGNDCVFCCWEWNGFKRPGTWNYGMFFMEVNGRSRQVRAHRIAWEMLNKQPIPLGLWGCHYCSNPPCCNPMHIYPGTAKDNTQDAIKRGSFIDRPYPPVRYGEMLTQSKLTENQIRTIRQRHVNNELQSVIATDFMVSRATINMIVHGKIWRHVK